MLLELYHLIPQKPFVANKVLRELNLINTESPEWRFKLIVEILPYVKALEIKLTDSFTEWNLLNISNLLSEAMTYRHSNRIISNKLSQVLTTLSYEFIKTNNNKFDYEEFKKYLKDENNYSNFILAPKVISLHNAMWTLKWADGNTYSWQWMTWILKLKHMDVENILSVYTSDDEEVNKAIAFFLDKNNKEILKKEMHNQRNAGIEIVKHIIAGNNKDSKIFKLISN
jgi:hypothetical protein